MWASFFRCVAAEKRSGTSALSYYLKRVSKAYCTKNGLIYFTLIYFQVFKMIGCDVTPFLTLQTAKAQQRDRLLH